MLWIDYLSRFVHIITAITLIGGSIFQLWIVFPASQTLPAEQREGVMGAITARWKRLVHLGIALFLLTGFYNYFKAMPDHKGDGLYHALVGTKILLALAIFFIASALVGKSPALAAMRAQRGRWLAIQVSLAVVVVLISSFVKVRG